MKVDGGIPTDLHKAPRGPTGGGGGLQRHLDRRDQPRSVLPPAARRRAHDRDRTRHVDRRGVRPQPDDARQHRLGPAGLQQGAVRPRLGSQIKPHITKRFSMEWSKPAARMREMVLAIRAIWDTWLNGTPLAFRGEFYTHTLMTPFFTPAASDIAEYGVPKIFLAGVGS